MECGVCFHVYDEDNRRPRSLGCGHSFCSVCTSEMITQKGLACPTCRTVHEVTQLAQVPVNYSLIEILKLLELSDENLESRPKEETENFPPPSAPSPENLPGDSCEDHHLSWQYRCIPCNQWMCRDCLVMEHLDRGCRVISSKQALEEMMDQSKSEAKSRLSYYDSRLTRMRQYDSELEMHLQKHESQLRGLVMMTERQHRFVKHIQEERERVGRAIRDGREAKRVLELAISRSSEARTQEELTHALGNTQNCDARLQEWVSSCLLEFNTSGRKNKSIKQLIATAAALRIINATDVEMEKDASKGIYAVLDNAIMEQVRSYKGTQSNVKWGRLSLSYGHILLHALQASNPPVNSLSVQFQQVRSLVPTESPVVFLNVAVSGKFLGRLYLRLLGDTERARQFLQLCTGERGPCYRSTRFFSLQRPGEPGECLLGGDYDRGDGTGGFPLLEGLGPSSVYRAPVAEGLVAGSNGQHSALFGIFLRDWLGVSDTAIGHVIKNLELLQTVAATGKYRQLQVVDCGLVVPV